MVLLEALYRGGTVYNIVWASELNFKTKYYGNTIKGTRFKRLCDGTGE